MNTYEIDQRMQDAKDVEKQEAIDAEIARAEYLGELKNKELNNG